MDFVTFLIGRSGHWVNVEVNIGPQEEIVITMTREANDLERKLLKKCVKVSAAVELLVRASAWSPQIILQ